MITITITITITYYDYYYYYNFISELLLQDIICRILEKPLKDYYNNIYYNSNSNYIIATFSSFLSVPELIENDIRYPSSLRPDWTHHFAPKSLTPLLCIYAHAHFTLASSIWIFTPLGAVFKSFFSHVDIYGGPFYVRL